MVTWSDGGARGKFSPGSSCTLIQSTSVSTCSISYTPSVAGTAIITATYLGDATHYSSSGTAALAVK